MRLLDSFRRTGSRLWPRPHGRPAFIVTLYGDVVEPRGGMLWMGTLIECCAVHGLNESLVRTAVSRLVGAGRLEGVRIGRRSYYRLSDAARDEFRDAARLLFSPPPAPEDWLLCLSEGLREADLPDAWARLSPNVAIAPNREDVAPLDGILMRAKHLDGHGDLRSLSRERWGLDDVASSYDRFVKRHSGLLERMGDGAPLSPAESARLAASPRARLPACGAQRSASAARSLAAGLALRARQKAFCERLYRSVRSGRCLRGRRICQS